MIFGDFVGWDWRTPAILQQGHPFVWLWFEKVGIDRPPPQLGQNPKFFQKSDLKAPLKSQNEKELKQLDQVRLAFLTQLKTS